MIDLWWEEAEKYKVLPLDNRLLAALMEPRRGPLPYDSQVIWPFGAPIPENRVVHLRGRAHRLSASVIIPPGGASGILLAMGTVLGGWSFQLLDGRLRYINNFVGASLDVISAADPVALGRRELAFEYTPGSGQPGVGRLFVDGYAVAEGEIAKVPIARYNLTGGGLTCGWEQGPAVGADYSAPFTFTGTLERVVITVDGASPPPRPEAEFEAIMSEQ
jgi:arylsulfatase